MSFTSRDWSAQYEATKRKIQSKRQSGHFFPTQEFKSIGGALTILEAQLKTMQATPMEFEIAASELARRQVLVDNLKRQLSLAAPPIPSMNITAVAQPPTIPSSSGSGSGIFGYFTGSASSTSSSNSSGYKPLPSGSESPSFVGSNGGGMFGSNSSTSTINPITSDKGLVQRQEEVIRLQDDMLGDISKGVDRLHEQAKTIGEEAKIQIRLLDDLDGNVELATTALQAETKHAEKVREKARACYMYICIAVEVIILLILAVLYFMS